MNKDNLLISSILNDAKKREEEILNEAKLKSEEIVKEEKEKLEVALREEERKYNEKISLLEESFESEKRSLEKEEELKVMNSSYTLLLDSVKEEFVKKAKEESFQSVLITWIFEAAIGLGEKECVVDYSPLSVPREKTLKSVEAKCKEIGLNLTLELGKDNLKSIGVSLRDKSGKISFTNTLDVRMRRFSREIRKVVLYGNAKENR